ncbi:cyclic nucleotide-binding domain-containing protein [Streptomyces sp. GMY02]|uniref:ATP-binding protein n=1 Tax=Streptomyces sp. GMY02 TaxID=1333528 RepID=UPI001C2C36EF|nr:ATP-binding protein [Streptomyces sp. GMY02]QXE32998.1 cyclic nucleotide-binding domain-containing protein [Streptomyces sp. GMY02]
MTASDRLTPDQVRTLFLFESLDDGQLGWLAERGRVEVRRGGTAVYQEGEPATCFFVLLSGAVTLSRRLHGDDIEVTRTDKRGVYGGATQAYLGDRVDQAYPNTMRAVSDAEFFVLPAEEFADAMRDWFPMALHLLEGLFFGTRAADTVMGERERLVALGALSAGLTHELNNPAAAAVRATEALRERVSGMRHKLALIADGRLDGTRLRGLVELQDAAVKQAAAASPLSALAAADAEDEIGDWLEEHEVANPWDLAPVLVSGGVGVPWLSTVAETVGEDHLDSAVRWLAYAIDTELLMGEIDDAVTRVSDLVGAAKQYSQLDRAPHRTVDVHTLLDATLTMLKGKIPAGIRVVKQYDRDLPEIPAYGAELNQVWTNLIDNAVDAMGDEGTLTLATRRDGEQFLVEVADTGPGIPAEIRPRIFEPFFTTKSVGDGTGLGLDISYRIVVNKHRGDIRVQSQPGNTRFQVLLPITQESPTESSEASEA